MKEKQALLSAVYRPLIPVLNFFMSTQKLTSKTRAGSKEINNPTLKGRGMLFW
ncbi:MAG: hypothetical protein LBD31_01500 [Treponema sp.]|nr:hypothetical protein [Treponema sp.]